MRTTHLLLAVLALACLHGPLPSRAQTPTGSDRLVLHEWGTFTVLQDESGRPIAGVNINEESLPDFVHRLANGLAPDSAELGPLLLEAPYHQGRLRSKGIPRFYPAVTMRLETPIIYLYPPAEAELPMRVDVGVEFRRGWVSEWYPHARNEAPGFEPGANESLAGRLTPETVSRIRWDRLLVGVDKGGVPETTEHVWLAPRHVPAATVRNDEGETERYLFYRGVANLESPLRVVRDRAGQLEIRPNRSGAAFCPQPLNIPSLWLVDIRADGRTAFRELGAFSTETWSEDRGLTTPAQFPEHDFGLEQRQQLRASMRRAVVEAGLFAPEADALLNTWEASYFKSPGLRLFFLVPRPWTDAVLPLTVWPSADIERVMIGRIELVTPAQRALLRQMAATTSGDLSWFSEPFARIPEDVQTRARRQLLAGERTLADFGIQMPESYRCYLALGRFRDALVLETLQREPSPGLSAFAETYGLRYFKAQH